MAEVLKVKNVYVYLLYLYPCYGIITGYLINRSLRARKITLYNVQLCRQSGWPPRNNEERKRFNLQLTSGNKERGKKRGLLRRFIYSQQIVGKYLQALEL